MSLLIPARERARSLDRKDELRRFRNEFAIPSTSQIHSDTLTLPSDNTGAPTVPQRSIYLCGNSLGLQPMRTATRIQQHLSTWAAQGVQGHFKPLADSPLPTWLDADAKAAEMIAPIVGAETSEVAIMQTLTANLHLLLSAFYRPETRGRHKIILESKAFPSDHFAVETQIRHHGLSVATSMVVVDMPSSENPSTTTHDVMATISRHAVDTAVLLLPGIQYYSGEFLDIPVITDFAHAHGIFVIWDLAHAVGNVPLRLHDWDVDAAVWCSYKYLNSGPGGIGGLFVHTRHSQVTRSITDDQPHTGFPNRLAGWWGNDKATRFVMTTKFHPVPGAAGFQLSNPSILDITSLCASLEVFREAGGVDALRKKSVSLTGFLEALLNSLPSELRSKFRILTPSVPALRGAQLSLLIGDGLLDSVMDALLARSVIADERKPNVIRVAPAPLYNSYEDCVDFVEAFEDALKKAGAPSPGVD
ncbi:kynureninase [Sporothrix schenckii 1099-18]|uniref:Kynureninase n=1 Tax=Sporothrix schenckii 1099-18 TaxID=1397361 RepID=A0A0F2MJU4_SPOSC|nr:kynureninase [Sporothrix schenckii 1099-18]KJR89902.1 kynureninase [Sporothrix schenckii 1099-18]